MSKTWQVQDAKARFSELIKRSLVEGPLIVTKRGVETAVLVFIDERRRLERRASPDLKELLLAPETRTDALTPPRPQHHHRRSPSFKQVPPLPRRADHTRKKLPMVLKTNHAYTQSLMNLLGCDDVME